MFSAFLLLMGAVGLLVTGVWLWMSINADVTGITLDRNELTYRLFSRVLQSDVEDGVQNPIIFGGSFY